MKIIAKGSKDLCVPRDPITEPIQQRPIHRFIQKRPFTSNVIQCVHLFPSSPLNMDKPQWNKPETWNVDTHEKVLAGLFKMKVDFCLS